MTTSLLQVADYTGDSTIEWDPQNAGSVEIARVTFEAAKGKGYAAYREDGEDREIVRAFDPTAGRIVMMPQMVGG